MERTRQSGGAGIDSRAAPPGLRAGQNQNHKAQPQFSTGGTGLSLPSPSSEPEHPGEAQLRGDTSFWVGHLPQPPRDAGREPRAVHSHSPRFAKGDGCKGFPPVQQLRCLFASFPNLSSCPHTSAGIPQSCRAGMEMTTMAQPSPPLWGVLNHLISALSPAFSTRTCCALSAQQMMGLCSHITRQAGTPALLCFKVTEPQNGLG